MKKLYLFTLLIFAFAAANAQYTILKGGFNTPLANKKFWLEYISMPGQGVSMADTALTDSTGSFTSHLGFWGTYFRGLVKVRTINCFNDTIIITQPYDSTVMGDTLLFNFDYCDSVCGAFDGSFGFTDTLKVATFTTTTTGANKYTWDFGDGTTSSLPNPVKTYAAYGLYFVRLTIEDTVKGCKKHLYKYIYIDPHYTRTVIVRGKIKDRIMIGLPVSIITGDALAQKTTTVITNTNSNSEYISAVTVYTPTGYIPVTITGCAAQMVYSGDYYDSLTDTLTVDLSYCAQCEYFNAIFSYSHLGVNKVQFNGASTANTFSWNFGDGGTSNQSNPSHQYTSNGTYNVCLIAQDSTTGCADTTCKNVTVYFPPTSIYGRVLPDSGQHLDSLTARVYLIRRDSVGTDILLTATDSAYIRGGGYYHFTNVQAGYYSVKAALLTASPYYASYVPTYHTQASMWSGAAIINTALSSTIINKNIQLIAGTNPGGSGFIGGMASMGANKAGDPMEQIEVLLLNAAGKEVAYTYTDVNGEYELKNLAFGTYRVLAEIPGKPSEEYTITLNQTNPGSTNNNFDVNSRDIRKSTISTTTVDEIINGNPVIYPNPANAEINIALDAAGDENAQIFISDIAGKIMLNSTYSLHAGKNKIMINTQQLDNGIYFIAINTNAGIFTQKITIFK